MACVDAGVVHRQTGASGHRHRPPPGRCGHAYARHRHGGFFVGRCGMQLLDIGPRWCRRCDAQSRRSSSHTAYARHRSPPFVVAVHRRRSRALSVYAVVLCLSCSLLGPRCVSKWCNSTGRNWAPNAEGNRKPDRLFSVTDSRKEPDTERTPYAAVALPFSSRYRSPSVRLPTAGSSMASVA